MATERSLLVVDVDVIGERKLNRLANRFRRLEDTVRGFGNRLTTTIDDADAKWKRHFDFLDKAIKGAGMALTKFVGFSAKYAAVQVGALGLAMMAVHAAFVLGNAAMKAFRGIAQLAAGAAAGLTIAVAAATAAIREQQAAMFAYKGTGKNEFGSGLNQIRVEMRGLMNDASLAAVGAENLNAAFATIARRGTFNQSSQAIFRGLMDFASAGQDIKTGSQAAAELVAALTDPKANFSQISEAAKKLGPEMEKALAEAQKKGIDTADELRKSILDGSLAVLGGVEGQFDAFNSTLINRGKAVFAQIREMFTDMGQPYLEPLKKELHEVSAILRTAFISVYGDIETFAQGNFIENISVVTEKVADFFVKMIHEYLPKVDGMFNRMGEWWDNFKEGWNTILNTLRPLIDGARVLEKTLMEILRPAGNLFGEAFEDLNNLIVTNEKEFLRFGASIGRFITEFSEFSGALRDIFVDALPFLTKVVDGATQLFDIFTSLLGTLQKFTGGLGAFGPFGLLATLLTAGRGMKNTIGGAIQGPNVKAMNVNAGVVNVGGKGIGGMTPMGTLPQIQSNAPGGSRSTTTTPPQGILYGPNGQPISTIPQTPQPTGGTPIVRGAQTTVTSSAELREWARVNGVRNWRTLTEAQLQDMGVTFQNFDKAPSGPFGRARQSFRDRRSGYMATRLMGGEFGGKQYKGFNKSMGGGMAASLGLGLLSNVAGPEAQGALALGSTVGMFNPLAGLAVGLGGAALTSTTAAGGALAGAGAGAAMGAFLGPGGMLAGAAIGGLVGGITGWINGDKKAKKAAKNAGTRAMTELTQSAVDGMAEQLRKTGPSAMTSQNIGQYFDNMTASMNAAARGFDDLLTGGASDDDIRKYLEAQRAAGNALLEDVSQADFDAMLKKPKEALKGIVEESAVGIDAAAMVQQKFEARMPYFADLLGKTEEEVIKLADATGVNLFDAFKSTDEMVRELAEGMIDSFREVQMAAGDALGKVSEIFTKPLEQLEGTFAFDETIRNLGDALTAGTLIGDQGRAQVLASFQSIIPQLTAMKGGDQLAALFEFNRMFNTQTGTLYSQAGGNLEGRAGELEMLSGGAVGQSTTLAMQEAGKIVSEYLVANLLKVNQQLGAGQAELVSKAVQSGDLTETEIRGLMDFIETNDLNSEANRQELNNMINSSMSADVKFQQASGTLATAAIKMEGVAEAQYAAAQLIIGKLGGGETTAGTETEGDTRTRRAIGDTGTNLSKTLSAHNRLTSDLPGKRVITSSYRNFALGSMNSDHVTGNALDLVGDNLVSYRDAVKRSGGFAEFHGGFGDSKHLHVVPNTRAMGDSTMQVAPMASTPSASGEVTVNNTFNISGVNGSQEELVQTIVARINASVRDAKERS